MGIDNLLGPHQKVLNIWTATMANATAKTLAELKTVFAGAAAVVDGDLRELILYQEDSTSDIRFLGDGEDAAAGSARLPSTGLTLPLTKTRADLLSFYEAAPGGSKITVIELG